MSNIGTKIERLIADGFSYNTLRGLSESQVNLLYTRLIEQGTPPNTTPVTTTTTKYKVKPNSKTVVGDIEIDTTGGGTTVTPLKEDDTINVVDDPDATEDGMGMFEGEMTEKFESKSQQRLFWGKCENAKTEKSKKKWCKWAKEFSKKTDFKKLPEKKLEESLTKLVEKHIPESISKKELMSLIEASTRTKEAPSREKTREKETPSKPQRKNPFKIEPAQKPGPKALKSKLKSELDEAGAGAPAKAPVKTPTKTPSKPQRKNPFKIEPAQKPGPKATKKGPEWLSYNSFIKAGYRLK